MGLFSFIKSAGEKLFGLDKKESKEAKVAKDIAAERKAEEAAASKLKTTIHDLGLKVEDLVIHIDDDVATVLGKAENQAEREKIVLVIGNSIGIATVDDKMTVEHTEPEAQFHTVEKGDTLSKISKTYYGNAMKYNQIFEANKPMLKSPDLIYPGQVLRIPALDE